MEAGDRNIKSDPGDGDSSDETVERYEDRDSLGRTSQALGISIDYVPGWVQSDGFREFYQNWFVIY
jgi:hypothetical protein